MHKLIKPILAFTTGLVVLGGVGSCVQRKQTENKIINAQREYDNAVYDYVSTLNDTDIIRHKLDSLTMERDRLILGDPKTLEERSYRALLFNKTLEDNLSRKDKKALKNLNKEIDNTQLRLDIATGKVLEAKKNELDSLVH